MTGEQLLRRWAGWLQQWVVLTEVQALVCALWAINSHLYDQFAACPFLSVTASTRGSGKTTLLKALRLLCRGGEVETTIRVLSMVRKVEGLDGKVTLLIDEAEKLSSEQLGETRTIIASMYQRGAQHSITRDVKAEPAAEGVEAQHGASVSISRYRAYAPLAFATIGDIQPILRDRAVVVDLFRAHPAKSFTLLREQAELQATELQAEFLTWFKRANVSRIPTVDPDWLTVPRNREIWSTLFSVAAFLGVEPATMAMLEGYSVDNEEFKKQPPRVFHDAQAEEDAEGRLMTARLLRDMAGVYAPTESWLPSEVIVERLRANVRAPWRGYRVTGLSPIGLSVLLDAVGVEKHRARVAGESKGRRAGTSKSGKAITVSVQENPRQGYRQADVRAALAKLGE